MKHTKKSSLIYALFFLFICTGIQAQKFDIDQFHIPEGLDLSSSEYERLQNTGNQLKEKLVTDLRAQGYDVIYPRKSVINLKRTPVDDIRIDYDQEADQVIFGKLVKTIDYIAVYAYLYDASIPIRSFDKPIKEITLNRRANALNDPQEINAAVSEIIAGLSLDRSGEIQAQELERQKQEELARQKEAERKKQEELLQQGDLERQRQEELAQQEEQKRIEEERKKIEKEVEKPTKVCSKIPGATLIVAGGVMGGTGLYLRSKALKIYDDEYRDIVGEPGDKDKLEEARKPNRMAHIIGAGGILTAGIGAYLWAKCSKNQKSSSGIGNIQITPHLEYNAMTNTNNVTARISFNF